MTAKFSWRCCPFPVQRGTTLFADSLRGISRTCCVVLLLLMVPLVHAAKVEDFIPKDITLYLKLQDIDEVYGEIEISENWEKTLALLSEVADWQEMQQGLAMLHGMLGTDLSGIVETVGYRTALAIWLDEADSSQRQTGMVIHSGGNLDTLRQLTKIVEGLLGMGNENALRLDAGVYQRVRYNVLEGLDSIIKYGFVDECLVIGAGEGSFEKLLDTYRTDLPSIQQNPEVAKGLENIGSGEVVVFADVPHVLPIMEDSLDKWMRTQFPIFKSVFGRLNLLETSPFLRVAMEFDPNLPENEIGLFLKEGHRFKTLNALSDKEDLFVSVAPSVLESAWRHLPTGSAAATRMTSFFEDILNLDFEADIITGLTGEFALSIPDFTDFDSEAFSGFIFEFDGSIELDAGVEQTNGGFIFSPSNRTKWNLISNSLSNLQHASVSQTDYKGTTVSGFASNIYYSEIDELFLLGFSETQVYTLIDRIKQKQKPSYLEHLPKTPTAFAQLNLARVLEFEKGSPPADKLLVPSKEMPRFLTWLSVENDVAVLEMTISEEETPIEMLAKLVPFFIWNIDVIWWE